MFSEFKYSLLGAYHWSELADRIGHFANGTRQFSRTERAAYDQSDLHSTVGRQASWSETALSSTELTCFICELADPTASSEKR